MDFYERKAKAATRIRKWLADRTQGSKATWSGLTVNILCDYGFNDETCREFLEKIDERLTVLDGEVIKK